MGKLNPAGIFGSGMVLQRRKPVCVWGTVSGSKAVTVSCGGATVECEADYLGNWKVYLPAMEAATGLEMRISSGGDTLLYTNVAVGEVWIAGGQSNMEMLMNCDADREFAYANIDLPNVRFFETPKYAYIGQAEDDFHAEEGFWRVADKDGIPKFSAVGFWFAKYLYDGLGEDIPVGVVGCNWGGTSAGGWMPKEYFTENTMFSYDDFYKMMQDNAGNFLEAMEITKKQNLQAHDPEQIAQRLKFMSNGITTPAPEMSPMRRDPSFFENMRKTRFTPFSAFGPCHLYWTMLKKIVPYTTAGFLWYQGEQDVRIHQVYDELLGQMIKCWRDEWNDEELPFYIVQLPGLDKFMVAPGVEFIPIRAQQAKVAAEVPNCGIVCTMDVGMAYDIHPKRKQPVGQRLALLALAETYGKDVIYKSPKFESAVRGEGFVRVTMSDALDGLAVTGSAADVLDLYVNGEKAEFEASVSGSEITYTSAAIVPGAEVEVRCFWLAYTDSCIANSAGLPAFPYKESV